MSITARRTITARITSRDDRRRGHQGSAHEHGHGVRRENLREELEGHEFEAKRKKIVKRLKLIEAFMESGARPEWMVLDVVPVIPPELRPLVPLDGGRFARPI